MFHHVRTDLLNGITITFVVAQQKTVNLADLACWDSLRVGPPLTSASASSRYVACWTNPGSAVPCWSLQNRLQMQLVAIYIGSNILKPDYSETTIVWNPPILDLDRFLPHHPVLTALHGTHREGRLPKSAFPRKRDIFTLEGSRWFSSTGPDRDSFQWRRNFFWNGPRVTFGLAWSFNKLRTTSGFCVNMAQINGQSPRWLGVRTATPFSANTGMTSWKNCTLPVLYDPKLSRDMSWLKQSTVYYVL